jgi:hypothetical protein
MTYAGFSEGKHGRIEKQRNMWLQVSRAWMYMGCSGGKHIYPWAVEEQVTIYERACERLRSDACTRLLMPRLVYSFVI